MTDLKPCIVLRAACRPEIGTGHLRRCLTLARTLAQCNVQVEVIADDHQLAHRLLAEVEDVSTSTAPAGEIPTASRVGVGTLVLDMPAEKRPLSELRAHERQLVELDRAGVAIVALGHATTESSHLRAIIDLYPSAQITALNYIEGPQYLILRPEFRTGGTKARAVSDGPILIAMGGSDPFDLAGTTLRALAAISIDRPVHLILGLSSSLDFDHACALADELGLDVTIDVELSANALVDAMRSACVAIAAFGTMAFELMALGVPVVGMSHYQWQDESARWFANLGAMYHVGCAETGLDVESLAAELGVLRDNDALLRVSRRGCDVVDGRGAERVAELLVGFAHESGQRTLDELYVLAHPGDEVFGCGATIASQTRNGARVGLVILGEGNDARRDNTQEPGEIVDSRTELARALERSSERLGIASLYYYRFADNRFDRHDLLDLVKPIEVLLERHRPRRVWTHHPNDLNIDHRRIFEAVVTAARPRSDSSVEALLSIEVPSSSDWGSILGGGRFLPNWFEDIEELLDLKLTLAAGYPSELRESPHPRSIDGLRIRSASWGSQCGLAAAEAFVLHRRVGRSG